MRPLPLLLLASACAPSPAPGSLSVGAWTVQVADDGASLTLDGPDGQRFDAVRLAVGSGTQSIQESAGAFLFEDVQTDWHPSVSFATVEGQDALTVGLAAGEITVRVEAEGERGLRLVPEVGDLPDTPRFRVSFACDADEHALGLGEHTDGIDHVGEAFGLWVSEQGIGKVDTDIPPDDWFITGRRHSSYFPVPFLLRPQQPAGLLVDTTARVEVDLCATDPGRSELVAWDAEPTLRFFAAPTALGVVESLTDVTGRPRRLPDWALAPWNDAIRGAERVREVAATLREARAPSSVIWTEDWKGAEQTFTGYRLDERWTLDEALYPDATDLDAELEAQGFKWFAYFAAFVGLDDADGQDAVAHDAVIVDAAGFPVQFPGITFQPTSMPDVSGEPGRTWAMSKMQAAVDVGFDGWMVDFGEWLPTTAVLAGGQDALAWHNAYPAAWQATNDAVLEPAGGVGFCRSGWAYAALACPIVWLGDQRTDFQPDDGMPTVLPMSLGLGASGIPVTTHDVAGYISLNNPPSDQELWFRWAWLGAFSPILRTHHGSSDDLNHQFDTNEETLALWVRAATEHMRLFPYRAALARQASERGTPMTMPTAFLFDGEPWDRHDAWMLGPALLVAPVVERDARSLDVALPSATTWYDWWTHAPATSGVRDVPLDTIPVFAAAGTTVPLFDTIPDTLAPTTDPDLVDLAEADAERVVLLFGGGGPFTEADGTTYVPSGTPTGAGEVTETLQDGSLTVAGVTLTISGPRARRYDVIVVP